MTCSLVSTSIRITLPASAINAKTLITFSITNIRNPKTFATPSDFTISVKTSDNANTYASGPTTNKLVNNVTSSFVAITGTFSSTLLGTTTTLVTTFQASTQIPSSIEVTIPSYLTVPTSLSCTSITGFTGSCSNTETYTIRLSGTMSLSSLGFTIQGITIPNSPPSSNQYVIYNSYDSSNNLVDSSKVDVFFNTKCTLPCRTCDNSVPTNCLSCYSNVNIS